MNKNIMDHIIFTVLLLAAQRSLFAMELIPFPPSNSSSEMCFLINNITPQYAVPEDTKKELLTLYIAVTNDERRASHEYDILINIPDYMNLNKHNKCYIQELLSANTPMRIDGINNKKMIVLTAFPNAQVEYQKMLELPHNVRRKMAAEYSSMIIVTGPEHKMNSDQVEAKETIAIMKNCSLTAGMIATTTTILSYFLSMAISDPFIATAMIASATPVFKRLIYEEVIYPLTKNLKYRYHNGYELLPLLPEDDNK